MLTGYRSTSCLPETVRLSDGLTRKAHSGATNMTGLVQHLIFVFMRLPMLSEQPPVIKRDGSAGIKYLSSLNAHSWHFQEECA